MTNKIKIMADVLTTKIFFPDTEEETPQFKVGFPKD